jgi:tagatose-1,6-bisphosphate aldolase
MRLHSIKNTSGIFSLLDFSRIATLAESIGLDIDHLEHKDVLDFISGKIMEYISPEISGVIVDPEFDFENINKKSSSTGLAMSLEKKSGSVDPFALPNLADNWGIEQIKNNYGLAKLELYYHPQEEEAMRKKQFVAEVSDFCKYESIDFLLELMVYHPGGEKATKEVMFETQLQAISEFSRSCDIMGLEFLGDSLSAVTITAQLDIPWIYNAREIGYEEFKQNLRVCMESGAKGFMAGDPIWSARDTKKVLSSYEDREKIEEHIKTDMRDKVIEANRIASEL